MKMALQRKNSETISVCFCCRITTKSADTKGCELFGKGSLAKRKALRLRLCAALGIKCMHVVIHSGELT